jgi:hypothetical protein
MEPVTRRSFLVTGSAGALGVAGVVVGGPRVASALSGASNDDDPEPSADELVALSDPAVLNIRDAQKGELELLIGERSIVFTDPRFVARLIRAARAL